MNNYKAYFALEKKLNQAGFREERKEIIEDFTNGEKSSLKELTAEEYKQLTKQLQKLLGTSVKREAKQDWMNTPENRMRRKIIANLRRCGFTKDGKADIERINHWATTHGHAHKPLNDYNKKELVKLVTQSENYLNKIIQAK